MPSLRIVISPDIFCAEDGLSASITAVGRGLREEVPPPPPHVRRIDLLRWYLMIWQIMVVGHDQKQLQVRSGVVLRAFT